MKKTIKLTGMPHFIDGLPFEPYTDKRTYPIKISRVWSMPNKWTFTIKPIRELLAREVNEGIWCDPFAGQHSPAQITNDLNPSSPTKFHYEALDFLRDQKDSSFDGVLFDPPYSPRQIAECYKSVGKKASMKDTQSSFWSNLKIEIARITKPNGKVICFGWNSMGIGKNRGFEMIEVLIVPHGGYHNDTICTVEIKKVLL